MEVTKTDDNMEVDEAEIAGDLIEAFFKNISGLKLLSFVKLPLHQLKVLRHRQSLKKVKM